MNTLLRLKALVCVLAGSFSPHATLFADKQPNIILYFSDDLGYGDLAFMGHPYATTPNLDKLASEGTVFMQHYVTGVTCHPSRAGLMTGVHPSRFPYVPAEYGTGDRTTITDLLSDHGYQVGHFGKWHMGPAEDVGTYSYHEVFSENNNKNDFKTPSRDDPLTDHAIDFIERMAKDGKPFYANVWGHSTHFPVMDHPEFEEIVGDFEFDRADFKSPSTQHKFDLSQALKPDLKDSMTQYLGDIYGVDRNLGRIVETVKRLGIEENTIIVFSSDQGPADIKEAPNPKAGRKYEEHMLGDPGPLRGGKHTQWEGGVRVPFVIWWPGKIEAGRVDTESVTSFIDWLPTISSIVGIEEIPENLDGEDISDIWFEGPRGRQTDLFWKVSNAASSVAMRSGKWKFHSNYRGKSMLFDLSNDLMEENNLIDQFPELTSEFKSKVESLNAVLPKDYIRPPKQPKMTREEFDALEISAPLF